MAIFKAYAPVDLTSRDIFYGNLLESSSSRITISDGYNKGTYIGNFSYSIHGEVFGVLKGYKAWAGKKLVSETTGLKANAHSVFYEVQVEGDAQGAMAIAFRGSDKFYGSNGGDVIRGWGGPDELIGNKGKDHLIGDQGKDKLRGGPGADTLEGRTQNDKLFGGTDTDKLYGGDGNDTLRGEGQDDKLWGGRGDDKLWGDRGNDVLQGDRGDDRLSGGRGRDELTGGPGEDSFTFLKFDGKDRITDFQDDIDTIRLDNALWNGTLTRTQVVNKFAEVKNGNTVFDFGDEKLVVENFTNLAELVDDIQFV